jgi:hypothetical protein
MLSGSPEVIRMASSEVGRQVRCWLRQENGKSSEHTCVHCHAGYLRFDRARPCKARVSTKAEPYSRQSFTTRAYINNPGSLLCSRTVAPSPTSTDSNSCLPPRPMPVVINAGGSLTGAIALCLVAWGVRTLRAAQIKHQQEQQRRQTEASEGPGRFYAEYSLEAVRLLVGCSLSISI